ncbi:amino acid permease [Sulfolobus acidocaldarius SUSAZ]|nr:amino acid permease [Sulfolobus acidocaldarius SUSAZ]
MQLSKGSLSIRESYGQAMAVTAPLGSVVSTTTAAIAYAGKSVLFATLLAFLASLLWMFTLTKYTKKIASPGGYYTFGSAAWRNKTVAYYEAITEVIAYSSLNAVNSFSVYLLLKVTFQMLNLELPGYVLPLSLVIGLIYPTLSSVILHIRKVLGYIVSISATLEVIFLYVLFGYAVATRGFDITYLSPIGTNFNSLGTAMVLTIVSIAGAGAATYLGEETKKPTSTITTGIKIAYIVGGGAILAGTYALVALWNGPIQTIQNSPQPLIQELYPISFIVMLISLILSINSLLASNIGTTVGAARILFNLAREKAMPKVFSRLNSEREPLIATVVVGLISAIFALSSLTYTGSADVAFTEISFISSLFWLAGRIVDNLGAPVFYWRLRELTPRILIVFLGSITINLVGMIGSLQAPDMFQAVYLISVLAAATLWYIVKARKGIAGKYLVDENNQLITMEEYFAKARSK